MQTRAESGGAVARIAAALMTHLSVGAIALLLLVAVGQPLVAPDSWLHLALGRAYASEGPWLSEDPILFTAPGPPAPTAWLAGLALHAIELAGGFHALRIAHVALVAGILCLAWSLLRSASGSAVVASLGTGLFVALADYRLVQLRPDLVTILAALLLYRLLLERPVPASPRRIALAALLFAVWVNSHAGFLLGLVLVATVVGSLLLAGLLRGRGWPEPDRARVGSLALALLVGALATLANPDLLDPHLAYLAAGEATPALDFVEDEWRPLDLLALPRPGVPPSPLGWAIAWGMLVATASIGVAATRRSGSGVDGRRDAIDPPLLALAAISLVAMLVAVRFSWLGIFPLLLIGKRVSPWLDGGDLRLLAPAAVAALLVPGYLRLGDWPVVSQSVPPRLASYADPYNAALYHANAAWMLRDAGLRGRLFNRYEDGSFLGYWLAPELRVFIAGSLNFAPDLIDRYAALNQRRGLADGTRFEEILDSFELDLFIGIGPPGVATDARRRRDTITHLERAEGWKPIFRSVRTGVWLREDERNDANLERVACYYAREGVPFDPVRGFDPEPVFRRAPAWAIEHGVVPADFADLERRATSGAPNATSRGRLAATWAALGVYERSVEIDRGTLGAFPEEGAARRRLVWSLLHLDRAAEALAESEPLLRADASDPLGPVVAAGAQAYARAASPEERAGIVARLPLLTPREERSVAARLARPWPRLERGSSECAAPGSARVR
jgi:hypothetical protein